MLEGNCHFHVATVLEWIHNYQPLLKLGSPDTLFPLVLLT